MRAITPETPRRQIQIGGVILSAPTPFQAGDTLDENEAASINQTYLENVGNNFRAAVTKAKKLAIIGTDSPTPEQLKAVTDAQIKEFDELYEKDASLLDTTALQTSLDEVVAAYKMGVRRSSSVEVVDPVTKAARAIAKDKLKAALQKRGTKLNTVSTEWYNREIDKLLNKESPKIGKDGNNVTEEIWATAQAQVDLVRKVAADGLDDLDMSGSEKTEDEEGGDESANAPVNEANPATSAGTDAQA